MRQPRAHYMDLITDHLPRSVELVEVIRVVFTRGDGQNTVFREVTQYWSTDGTLLAEQDNYADGEDA